MFFETAIRGDWLPPRTLCLTYDDGPGRTENPDGPGPRTAELGLFLHSQGVAATFFAVGQFAIAFGEILSGLEELGHGVANHTFDHPSLPAFVAEGGDVVDQLARTDCAISKRIRGSAPLFRPPYGDWRLKGQERSNVAAVLNHSALATSHIGPIGWDIDARDVGFWRDDRPAQECALAYLEAIEATGRGIVLMHDCTADIAELRPRNQALALSRILVPELRRRGYRFVGLDAVPQVASAARVSFQVILADPDGQPVPSPTGGAGAPSQTSRSASTTSAPWGVVDLGKNQWGLRAANGLYLSSQPGDETVAFSPYLGSREIFAVEDLGGQRVALKTLAGTYLSRPSGLSHLSAHASTRGERETFQITDAFPR